MIYYLYILLGVLLLAVSFVLNKRYQLNSAEGLHACFVFNFLNGLVTAALFFVISWVQQGFGFRWTPYSLFQSLLQAVIGGAYVVIGFYIMARGKISLYTMFLMLGAMLLPYFYGIIVWNEPVTAGRVIGAVVLTASLVAFSLSEGRNRLDDKPITPTFILMCIAVFILNGVLSIITKMHQIAPQPTVGEADFIVLCGLMKSAVFGVALLFTKKSEDTRSPQMRRRAVADILIVSVITGLSAFFQLIAASHVDASVLYPMVTGGSVVLTGLTGWVIFKERLSKASALCIAVMFAATFLFLI